MEATSLSCELTTALSCGLSDRNNHNVIGVRIGIYLQSVRIVTYDYMCQEIKSSWENGMKVLSKEAHWFAG